MMKSDTINIMFLGGAKRVSMARLFKKAAADMNLKCEIISYEKSVNEAIACEAKVIPGKLWKDPDIYDHIRQIAHQHNVTCIIPFVDGAVPVAAALSDEFCVPTGSAELAKQMFDKVESARIFEQHNLPIPPTYHPGDPSLCLIAKPRHGSASKGIIEIHSLQTLDEILSQSDRYLIQQRIDNREEYTVDCYADTKTGEVILTCPRIRIEVAGGEVTRTKTIDDPQIIDLAQRTISAIGLRGAITIQMLRDLDNGRIMLMEINPRLGGGAVCSVLAGADIPSLIISQALGDKLSRPQWIPGVEIARYPAETVFYPNQK